MHFILLFQKYKMQQLYLSYILFMKIKPEYAIVALGLITVGVYFIVTKSKSTNNKINPKGKSVAFIGDSQMANFSPSGWQNQLAKNYGLITFHVPQNDEVGASKTSNLAVVGKGTKWMVEKLNKFYNSWKYKPDILFIYGGGNSITAGESPQSVIADTQQMVDIAKKAGTKHVYVIAGYRSQKVSLPSGAITASDSTKRDTYKGLLPTAIKGATVIPIWEQANASYSGDGLHISDPAKLKQLADYVGNQIFTK